MGGIRLTSMTAQNQTRTNHFEKNQSKSYTAMELAPPIHQSNNNSRITCSVSGIKWHDVACTHEKPIICEDVEGHLAYARQQFPQIRIP